MIALYHKWSAFHLVKVLFLNGILRGWLFSKGYAGLLATIETGADGINIKPFVNLYNKRDVRKLLCCFDSIDLKVHQLARNHFCPSRVANLIPPFITKLEDKLGWHIACRAAKPA